MESFEDYGQGLKVDKGGRWFETRKGCSICTRIMN